MHGFEMPNFIHQLGSKSESSRPPTLKSQRRHRQRDMASSEPSIIPALPLNGIPPSPRSDVSTTTSRSRDTDKSFDSLMLGIANISDFGFVPPQVRF